MYKIKVKNLETEHLWWEYGFTKWTMKRIHFLFSETTSNGFLIYEVESILKLCFSWQTFKKCLINKTEIIE